MCGSQRLSFVYRSISARLHNRVQEKHLFKFQWNIYSCSEWKNKNYKTHTHINFQQTSTYWLPKFVSPLLLCHMKTPYHLIWYLMVLMHYYSSVPYTLLCKILHINGLRLDVTKFFTYTILYKSMNRHFYSLHVYVTLIHTNVWLLLSKTIL